MADVSGSDNDVVDIEKGVELLGIGPETSSSHANGSQSNEAVGEGSNSAFPSCESRQDDDRGETDRNEKKPIPVLGIHMRKSVTCIAVILGDLVHHMPHETACSFTPVTFTPSGQRLIGMSAPRKEHADPLNTVYDINLLMGRKFDDPAVKYTKRYWPFKVVSGAGGMAAVQVEYNGEKRIFSPPEISAMILGSAKEMAEACLGMAVKDAVVAVPAAFTDAQRQATMDACAIAGLNVLQMINSTTAAAMQYCINYKKEKEERKVLIFRVGAQSSDVSIIELKDGVGKVRATVGNVDLGGDNFTNRLVGSCIALFAEKNRIDVSSVALALNLLQTKCEVAKKTMTSAVEASIDVPNLLAGFDFHVDIRHEHFVNLCADLFRAIYELIEKCLNDAGLDKSDIDDIGVAGDAARMPAISVLLMRAFPNLKQDPFKGGLLSGAAIYARRLSGDARMGGFRLPEFATRSIGIEVNGAIHWIIKRNTELPAAATVTYNLTKQDRIVVKVHEEENSDLKKKSVLAMFLLQASGGDSKIEVIFELDANGIFAVYKKDSAGDRLNIPVTYRKKRLTAKEIEKMAADEAKMRAADKAEKDIANHPAVRGFRVNMTSWI